jgi:hypothetical protein
MLLAVGLRLALLFVPGSGYFPSGKNGKPLATECIVVTDIFLTIEEGLRATANQSSQRLHPRS